MVDLYSSFLKGNEQDSEKQDKNDDFKMIWDIHPSYSDTNNIFAIFKAVYLVIIGIVFAICVYLLSKNIYVALGSAILLIIIFSLIFRESFFRLKGLFQFQSINPFKDIIFWIISNDSETIYYTNKVDLLTVGLTLFRIEVVPETVHANIIQFLRSLSAVEPTIPFSFQVIQRKQRSGVFPVTIYFSVFSSISGILSEQKILQLRNDLFTFRTRIQSSFGANFHHFKVKILSGQELIRAFRSTFMQKEIELPENLGDFQPILKANKKDYLIKGLFTLGLFVFLNVSFALFRIMFLYIVLINAIILVANFFLYWRDVLFHITKHNVFFYENVNIINPFRDVKFYYFHKTPYILFSHTQDQELTGTMIFNVNQVTDPAYCSFSKFYSGINAPESKPIPFIYTVISTPRTFAQFDKECFKYVNDKTNYELNTYVTREINEKNWLARRAGIWKSIILLSTSHTIQVRNLTTDAFTEIISHLNEEGVILSQSFKSNYSNYKLASLANKLLYSGISCQILKNHHIRLNGSYLREVYFQGLTLAFIIHIADELKKGLEVQVAAEFNTPTYLKSEIIFGNTVNTETLTIEADAGFTLNQLRSLLITNGIPQSREVFTMKIVAELIRKDIPSIIFDTTGNWAKILTYFKDTRYLNNILYFKLGKAFTLDPIHSETIPNDPNNLHYLEYMFDAYGLTFKVNKHAMDLFKNSIRRYQSVDLNNIRVDIDSRQPWEKDAKSESLLSSLHVFSQDDLAFFQATALPDDKRTKAHEFITCPQTIIVDVSDYNDKITQCLFIFVILSKFIHYISNNSRFVPKYLFIPHIDIIFEGKFLDLIGDFSKINKFFEPLLQNKFGLICLSNQIHYLHSNVFTFINNIMAFRSVDVRDTSILANLMNLNELHGTGYYNTKRKETYQILYLRNMRTNEALMKRADIYQPFPVVIDNKDLIECPPMDYHDIVEHMGRQGYDLVYSERRILAQAKKTLIEKDFEEYSKFIPEIINFFESIKTVDKVGGLFIDKVKKILMEFLSPKISNEYTQNKKKMRVIRDKIFKIMIDHQYLIESHPRSAGGSEQVGTSYAVGVYYEQALKDYYDSQQLSRFDVDIVSKESDSPAIRMINLENEHKIRYFLAKNLGSNIIMDLFNIHEYLKRKDYYNSLKLSKYFLIKFLTNTYKDYYKPSYIITNKDVNQFVSILSNLDQFPFTQEEIDDLLKKSNNIDLDKGDLEQESESLYQGLQDFYVKLKVYLELEEGS
ncbi:MAG: hypothetical protein ACFE8E_07125 [Candidatus Hodarchaeota archaeon]